MTALIAIDWGTTSARAYRMDATGAVLASRDAPLGIQAVEDRRYSDALHALLGDWRDIAAPRIACGMIGSRQGWIEAPYVECPCDLAGFGRSLARTPGGELSIVPGARCMDAGGMPDVMRGEETQIAGAYAERDGAMLAVLPGTHSKWAIVESGRLSSFATYMTGELYAVLLAHTLLGRMADLAKPSAVPPGPGFARGVERGLADAGLSHVIFGARTLALMGDLAPFDVPDWLSGALIGHEIRSARAFAREHGTDASEVTVIGADAIVARYAGALAQAGVAAHPGPTDAAARGLFEIACRAGIAY